MAYLPAENRSLVGEAHSPTSIRAINRARIISLIRRRPGTTRSELGRATGLAKGTISSLTAELLDKGSLYEDDGHGSRQRNTGLWLNREAGIAAGIELSPDSIRGVLTDVEVRALKRVQRPLPTSRVDETIEVLLSVTAELLEGTARRHLGLAVAVPGPTDARGERVLYSESMGWYDVPLAERLSDRLGVPVSIINRPKAGVLGEHWYGAGVGIDNLIYLSVSSGVAAGILIGGRLFNGEHGHTGEIGHCTFELDGPPCACGNHGCLEALAGIPAMTNNVQRELARGIPSVLTEAYTREGTVHSQDLIAAARDGDGLAMDEIRRGSRLAGVAVANLINLFNPRMVIVGGRLAEAGELALNTIRETAQRRTYPLSFAGVEIVRNALGADSACIGACALVVEQYLAGVEPAMLQSAGL